MIHIGIDTGTHTGIAVWVPKDNDDYQPEKRGKLIQVECHDFWQAVEIVNICRDCQAVTLHIEDARLAKFWKDADSARAQGAGSVKRDAAMWEGFAKHFNIPYVLHRPKMGAKIDADAFKRLTGWQGRTNEHSRDAGMMVFGLK